MTTRFNSIEKKCTSCNLIKKFTSFTINTSSKSGFSYHCLSCQQTARDIRRKDPENRRMSNMSATRSKDKIRHTEEFKARNNLGTKIRRVITREWLSSKIEKILGCNAKRFKRHLESQFTEGMSFDNYGEWQIDHILPVIRFDMTNKEEVKICWHYSNMRPMWSMANLSKGTKIISGKEQIKIPL